MTTLMDPEAENTEATPKRVLIEMDGTGDTRTEWDPNNEAEVEAARATFEKLVNEKKYLAYKVTDEGRKGEVVREFDPDAEKLILAPPMQGGS